jgi:hypothetical protein
MSGVAPNDVSGSGPLAAEGTRFRADFPRHRGEFAHTLLAFSAVPAIVGVLLSYASLIAGVPGAGDAAAAVCGPGDVCELPPVGEELTAYATPVEVDCRAISGTAIGGASATARNEVPLLSGGCSAPASDFRYRVSRFPDSERSSGGFAPGRTRRTVRSTETCTGLPPDRGSLVSASTPPMAIYAYTLIPAPPLAQERAMVDGDRRAPIRIIEPPDRPPRA